MLSIALAAASSLFLRAGDLYSEVIWEFTVSPKAPRWAQGQAAAGGASPAGATGAAFDSDEDEAGQKGPLLPSHKFKQQGPCVLSGVRGLSTTVRAASLAC